MLPCDPDISYLGALKRKLCRPEMLINFFNLAEVSVGNLAWCLVLPANASLTPWQIYGEWVYECNSPPIRNDHKVIARHS